MPVRAIAFDAAERIVVEFPPDPVTSAIRGRTIGAVIGRVAVTEAVQQGRIGVRYRLRDNVNTVGRDRMTGEAEEGLHHQGGLVAGPLQDIQLGHCLQRRP